MCAPLLMVLLVAQVAARVEETSPLRCRNPRCRSIGGFLFQKQQYEVDGKELWVTYKKDDGFLWINCIEASVMLSPSMPSAEGELTVWNVILDKCQLPVNRSIVDKLADLNVRMVFTEMDTNKPIGYLTLDSLPSESALTIIHFTRLNNLVSLNISADAAAPMRAARHFLDPLQSLRSLSMHYVKFPPGELKRSWPLLRELHLNHTGIKKIPMTVYKSLSIQDLAVESEDALDAVVMSHWLNSLKLVSPATTLRLDVMPVLEDLDLTHWTELQPQPLNSCYRLRKLRLRAPALHTLPYGWLANCSHLHELVIENARNLTTLQDTLFGSSHKYLTRVVFTEGILKNLSKGQFDNEFRFKGNQLEISRRVQLSSLEELDLSFNDLDGDVLIVVAEMYQLSTLNLANNPRLGDVCDEMGYSLLRQMTSLIKLYLSNTNISRICKDWREDMPLLEKLDLSNTSITTLSFEDLQFRRIVLDAEVLLQGASITLLNVTRDDFNEAKHTPTSGALMKLDARLELECDCRMYWTRRTMDSSPHALDRISELHCVDGGLLRERLPEDMVCTQSAECAATTLPEACTCATRPDDMNHSRQLLRVSCENAGLDHVPLLPASEEHLYELRLAHNHITSLHASELHDIKGLDLRHNFISRIDEETAAKLGSLGGILQLAGNPLECDCSAAPLLLALRSRALGYTSLVNATCKDGTALEAAPIVDCLPPVAWLVGGLAALFMLVVTIIVYLASRERRFFVKAVLHRWGCHCCVEVDEEDRRYDAFVTFSHKDEAVVKELVARLEPTYHLCLHYRDWIVGLKITEQIVESVQESRRTVALVSRHFLASKWTRVEFREAHEAAMVDARPRLIVVFLEDPAELTLDEHLQRYIGNHTYLRWGDPWFWDKMAVALPRPRQPPVEADPELVFPASSSPRKVSSLKPKPRFNFLSLNVRLLASARPKPSSSVAANLESIELAGRGCPVSNVSGDRGCDDTSLPTTPLPEVLI